MIPPKSQTEEEKLMRLLAVIFGILLVALDAFETIVLPRRVTRRIRLAATQPISFLTYLYLSGTTFFTLGLGDVTPLSGVGRLLVVSEVALGFIFLALVISYVPVLYQAFSRRKLRISLLDALSGTPPS